MHCNCPIDILNFPDGIHPDPHSEIKESINYFFPSNMHFLDVIDFLYVNCFGISQYFTRDICLIRT